MNISNRLDVSTIIGFGGTYTTPAIIGFGGTYTTKGNKVQPPNPPIIFPKFTNAIVEDGETIELMATDLEVYGEPELAVIIGEKIPRNTSEKDVLSYVAGYTVANDITGKGHMSVDEQWTRGKSADGYLPIGSTMITDLDPTVPHSLKLYIDGELEVDGSTNELVFGVAKQLAFLSTFMTLGKGTIILTGAPGAYGPLKDGQEMTVEINDSVRVTNKVIVRK